mgnify:CR=1 FL=1
MLDKNSVKTRNSIIDLLKIILTVLVVNVHIRIITGIKANLLEPYTWYTVPLFIVLSFFFFSSKSLITRIRRFFIPLIFWSAAGFIVHPDLLNAHNVLLQLLTGHVVNTPLYYLVLLTLFTIIYRLIDRLPSNLKIFIYFLIILTALFLEYSRINYDFFSTKIEAVKKSYGRFIELIKYVPIGLMFAFLKKKINNNNIFLVLSVIFLPIYAAASNISQPLDFHYSGLKTLVGSIIIFSLALGLSSFKFNDKVNSIISLLGKYSFGVYLSHYLLLETILKINPTLKSFIALYQIPFLLLYVASCYLFCFLFDLLTLKKLSYLVK